MCRQEYLFELTSPAEWLYNADTVTESDPQTLAKQCVRAALLNHLDGRNPYTSDIVSVTPKHFRHRECRPTHLRHRECHTYTSDNVSVAPHTSAIVSVTPTPQTS